MSFSLKSSGICHYQLCTSGSWSFLTVLLGTVTWDLSHWMERFGIRLRSGIKLGRSNTRRFHWRMMLYHQLEGEAPPPVCYRFSPSIVLYPCPSVSCSALNKSTSSTSCYQHHGWSSQGSSDQRNVFHIVIFKCDFYSVHHSSRGKDGVRVRLCWVFRSRFFWSSWLCLWLILSLSAHWLTDFRSPRGRVTLLSHSLCF